MIPKPLRGSKSPLTSDLWNLCGKKFARRISLKVALKLYFLNGTKPIQTGH